MTHRNQPEETPSANAEGVDIHWTPSQAEGDRETIDNDLGEIEGSARQLNQTQLPEGVGGDALSTPSQAEGDRDTIDRDLEQKLGS